MNRPQKDMEDFVPDKVSFSFIIGFTLAAVLFFLLTVKFAYDRGTEKGLREAVQRCGNE